MLGYWRVICPKAIHAELNTLILISQLTMNKANSRVLIPHSLLGQVIEYARFI